MSKPETKRQEYTTERLANIAQVMHDCLTSKTALPGTAAQVLIHEFMDAAWDFNAAIEEAEAEA